VNEAGSKQLKLKELLVLGIALTVAGAQGATNTMLVETSTILVERYASGVF
jgi:hypothetical protein